MVRVAREPFKCESGHVSILPVNLQRIASLIHRRGFNVCRNSQRVHQALVCHGGGDRRRIDSCPGAKSGDILLSSRNAFRWRQCACSTIPQLLVLCFPLLKTSCTAERGGQLAGKIEVYLCRPFSPCAHVTFHSITIGQQLLQHEHECLSSRELSKALDASENSVCQ